MNGAGGTSHRRLVDAVWPPVFWKRFLVSLVLFVPLAVIGWVVASLLVHPGFSQDMLWTALFIPVAAAAASLSSAALNQPGRRVIKRGTSER